jgi:hypothetical protein
MNVAGQGAAGGGEVQSSARVNFRAGLMWAMGLLLVAYVVGLALYGGAWAPGKQAWFNTVVTAGWVSWSCGRQRRCVGWRSTGSDLGVLRCCWPRLG